MTVKSLPKKCPGCGAPRRSYERLLPGGLRMTCTASHRRPLAAHVQLADGKLRIETSRWTLEVKVPPVAAKRVLEAEETFVGELDFGEETNLMNVEHYVESLIDDFGGWWSEFDCTDDDCDQGYEALREQQAVDALPVARLRTGDGVSVAPFGNGVVQEEAKPDRDGRRWYVLFEDGERRQFYERNLRPRT